MSSTQNKSNIPKVSRNAKTGEFVVGITAAKYMSLVEGLTMPQEMQQTFDQFERNDTQASERLAILKKKYGTAKG